MGTGESGHASLYPHVATLFQIIYLLTSVKPSPTECRRAKTAIAFETGNIQGMAERFIAESNDYMIRRIPQRSYDASLGEDPRKVRYSSAPIDDRPYTEMLVHGDDEGTMPGVDCNGQVTDITTNINNKGSFGCHIPGQTIHGGYDVFTRVLKGKAWETEPVCILDLILKMHYNDYIRMLRNDLPKRATEQFGYSLERNVIETAKYNTSVVNGFALREGAFPAPPDGTLDVGTVRRVFQILEAQGWTGAREVTTSQEAFETMRRNYKANTGLELQSTVSSSETHFIGEDVKVVNWAGINWVLTKTPTRGYLNAVNGGYEFVPVRPTRTRAGTGGGVVVDVNEDYFGCSTYCDGQKRELYEIGFYVHTSAATRESFAVPQVADKKFSNNLFNFEVKMIDGAYLPCNEDNLNFYFRMLHAYAFESVMPELMGAIIYRVQPDLIYVNAPVCNTGCVDEDTEVAMAQPNPVQHDDCSLEFALNDCSADVDAALLPVPTEADQLPAPAAGSLRFTSTDVTTEVDSGTVKIWVERIGGVDGTAGVTINTSNGTATGGDEFTDISPAVLAWADGEAGRKSVTITIAADGDVNTAFSVDRTSPTGAAWVGPTSMTVNIVEACDEFSPPTPTPTPTSTASETA